MIMVDIKWLFLKEGLVLEFQEWVMQEEEIILHVSLGTLNQKRFSSLLRSHQPLLQKFIWSLWLSVWICLK